jgi:hypothetical protein
MRRRVWLPLALGLGLTACATLSTADRSDIRRWLLCEECLEGELDRVVRLGDRAVPALAEALEAPPAEGRANMRRQSEDVHAGIDSPAVSPSGYAGHFESNYVANYQMRAARALSAIGTERAHAALVAAVARGSTYRPDVRRYVGSVAGITVSVAGDGQHAAVDSLVKVDPVVVLQDSATGQPLGNVRVAFRIDSGGGSVSDSVRLTDSSGLATVQWRMGDSARANVLRVVAGGRLVRVRAFSHLPGLRLVFRVQPSDGTEGQPLSPAPWIAVQDAFGVTQLKFNDSVAVDVVGLLGVSVHRVDTIVGGEVILNNFVVPVAENGLRLSVSTAGAATALSDSFDIAP